METVTLNNESSIDAGTEPEVVAISQESVHGADQSDHMEHQSISDASSASSPSGVDKITEDVDEAVEMQPVTSPAASEIKQDHDGPDASAPVKTQRPLLAADQKSAELWATAYASLHKEDPDLVREFEETVSRWLRSKETARFRPLNRRSTIGRYGSYLKGPLRDVISKVFEYLEAPHEPATDSSDRAESEADEDRDERSVAGTSSGERDSAHETVSESKDDVPLEVMLRGALQSSPHASLAWAAYYITLQTVAACGAKTRQNQLHRSLIATVTSKMQWFSQLFRLLWWSQQKNPPSLSASLRVKALRDLYKSVLSFHMRVTTQSDTESPLYIRDLKDFHLDSFSLSEEAFIKIFNDGLLSSQLEQYLDTSINGKSAAVNKRVEEVMAKLHVDRRPAPAFSPEKAHVMESLWKWAEETAEVQNFVNWHDRSRRRVLWVDAFPGAGKSSLMRKAADCLSIATSHEPRTQVVSFFCDDTRWRQGNVLSTVKELICGLLDKQPQDLLKYVEHIVDEPIDFETEESFPILCRILTRMSLDENFCSTYLLVDGLEQFVPDLDQPIRVTNIASQDRRPEAHSLQALLRLVVTTVNLSDKVKWILSTDRGHCDANLVFGSSSSSAAAADLQTHLVLGSSMSKLVQEYATQRVRNLFKESATSDPAIMAEIKKKLEQAPANFLWINVALDLLIESNTPWSVPDLLSDWIEKNKTTSSLFQINFDVIDILPGKDRTYCQDLLWCAATGYRALPITEIGAIIELPALVQIPFLVRNILPAFFEISDQRLHYRHLSARAFIRKSMTKEKKLLCHINLAQRCIEIVLKELQCTHAEMDPNTYTSGSDVSFEYIGAMWPRHLAIIYKYAPSIDVMGLAEHLLSVHLIDWLGFLSKNSLVQEAMSAMGRVTNAVRSADSAPGTSKIAEICHFFAEVYGLLSVYHREWFSQLNAKEASEAAHDAAIKSLKHELLLNEEYPYSKKVLWPALFPHLESLYRTESDVVLSRRFAHADWVRGCCFSPDGNLVASASDEAFIRLWDTQTWTLQDLLGRFDNYALGVVMSRAPVEDNPERTLLAAFDKKHIRLWDTTTGALLKTLSSNDVPGAMRDNFTIWSIALAPAGDLLAAVVGGELILWSLPEASEGRLFEKKTESPLRRIAFAPEGKLLAASFQNKIKVWNFEEDAGKLVCILPDEKEVEIQDNGAQGAVEVGSDARDAAASNLSEQPEIPAEVEEPPDVTKNILNSQGETAGHSSSIDGLAFSPDSKLLLSGSDDNTARIWDLETRSTIRTLHYSASEVNAVSFSHDGRYIAAGSQDGSTALWKQSSSGSWDASETQALPRHTFPSHERPVSMISLTPHGRDGVLLASSSFEGSLQIYEVQNGMDKPDVIAANNQHRKKAGHADAVVRVAVSEAGDMIATASTLGVVFVWNMPSKSGTTSMTRLSKPTCFEHEAAVLAMTFSPDGKMLATAASDNKVIVWVIAKDMLTPKLLMEHNDWVRAVQFNRKGDMLATGEDDGTVRVFHIPEGLCDGYTTSPSQHAPGPDDAIATDSEVKERVQQPGPSVSKPVGSCKEHANWVRDVAFSPDSTRLASCGHDENVIIWSLGGDGNLQPFLDKKKCAARVYSVAWTSNGSKVVSCAAGGSLTAWNPEVEGEAAKLWTEEHGNAGIYRMMRVDPQFPDFLLTEIGAVKCAFDGEPEDGSAKANDFPSGWLPIRTMWYKDKVLWFKGWGPKDEGEEEFSLPDTLVYPSTPLCYLVFGNKVIIGCVTGQVLVFEFKDDEVTALSSNKAAEDGNVNASPGDFHKSLAKEV